MYTISTIKVEYQLCICPKCRERISIETFIKLNDEEVCYKICSYCDAELKVMKGE